MKKNKFAKLLFAITSTVGLSSCGLLKDKMNEYWNNQHSSQTESSQTEPGRTYSDRTGNVAYNHNLEPIKKTYFDIYKDNAQIHDGFKTEFLNHCITNKPYNIIVNNLGFKDDTKYVAEALDYLSEVYSKILKMDIKYYYVDDPDSESKDYACAITYTASPDVKLVRTALAVMQDGKRLASIEINVKKMEETLKSFEEEHIGRDCFIKKLITSAFAIATGVKPTSEDPNSIFCKYISTNCAWKYSPMDLKTIIANYATIKDDATAESYKRYVDEMANDYYTHLLKYYFMQENRDNPTYFESEMNRAVGGAYPQYIGTNRLFEFLWACSDERLIIKVNEDRLQRYEISDGRKGECYIIKSDDQYLRSKNVQDFVVLEGSASSVKNSAEIFIPGTWGYQYFGKKTSKGDLMFARAHWCCVNYAGATEYIDFTPMDKKEEKSSSKNKINVDLEQEEKAM